MISACILTKNDQDFIARTIGSVQPYVSEIIVVDDKSIDNTKNIAASFGAKIYTQPFNIIDVGFSTATNWMLDQATQEWILIIDSDELLTDGYVLQNLTRFANKDAWALPRRKWLKFDKNERCEYEAYPDWQVRFIKNQDTNRFDGKMHVHLRNREIYKAYRGPHIEHLQDECRTPQKLQERSSLYSKLAKEQGVSIVGGFALELENDT